MLQLQNKGIDYLLVDSDFKMYKDLGNNFYDTDYDPDFVLENNVHNTI